MVANSTSALENVLRKVCVELFEPALNSLQRGRERESGVRKTFSPERECHVEEPTSRVARTLKKWAKLLSLLPHPTQVISSPPFHLPRLPRLQLAPRVAKRLPLTRSNQPLNLQFVHVFFPFQERRNAGRVP